MCWCFDDVLVLIPNNDCRQPTEHLHYVCSCYVFAVLFYWLKIERVCAFVVVPGMQHIDMWVVVLLLE